MALAVLLVAGSAGGTYLIVRSVDAVSPATPRSTQAGCGRPVETGSVLYTLTDQDRVRTTVVHVPPRYSDRSPTPLVVVLHGAGSNGPAMEAYTGRGKMTRWR